MLDDLDKWKHVKRKLKQKTLKLVAWIAARLRMSNYQEAYVG